MGKNLLPVVVILVVVVVAWVGFSIYFNSNNLNIDPNASSYTNPLNPKFDTKGLDVVMDKTEKGLPVSPDSFTVLIQQK